MLELGKRDLVGGGQLAMSLFEANRAFFGIDIAQMCIERPEKIRSLLHRCVAFYQKGAIQPIPTAAVVEAASIEDGFNLIARGRHIGKIMVNFPDRPMLLATDSIRSPFSLRADASYLLVGGLGGLGRSVSTWMAEHGARNLIYLSRSGGKGQHDASLVEELAAAGCTTQIITGSVTNQHDIRRALEEARMPIAGIMNATMVLRVSLSTPYMESANTNAVIRAECLPT